MPIGLMLRLKEETHTEHRSVEGAFSERAGDLSSATYLDLLQRFYRVVAPIEGSLESRAAFSALGLCRERFLREPALRRDIQFMGGQTVVAASYRSDSVAEAIGALYVLIGSMLGGQIIARDIRARMGLQEGGVEFFTFQGKGTSGLWKEFGEAVNRWSEEQGGGDAAVSGARKAFSFFDRELKEAGAQA